MNSKKINKVIFLGGNRYNEDAPLTLTYAMPFQNYEQNYEQLNVLMCAR